MVTPWLEKSTRITRSVQRRGGDETGSAILGIWQPTCIPNDGRSQSKNSMSHMHDRNWQSSFAPVW